MLPVAMEEGKEKGYRFDLTLYVEHDDFWILDTTEERLQGAVSYIRTDPHWQANSKPAAVNQRIQGCAGAQASKVR